MDQKTIKSAINRAWELEERLRRDLDEGRITEEQWYRENDRVFTQAYLARDNPRGQSGHSGDEAAYRYTQGMILEALHRDGSFIDVGCANGYLMEKLADWLQYSGLTIDFYGLDISEGLIALAKKRLPQWGDRFYLGNALNWVAPRRFTFVCVKELEYVPQRRREGLFRHLWTDCVAQGGRLILGPYTKEINDDTLDRELQAWGFQPSSYCEKSHQRHKELKRRLIWFDKDIV